MRIAFANHTAIKGSGIDHVAHNLAKELGKRHEVNVFAYQTEGEGDYYNLNRIPLPFSNNRIVSGILSPMIIPSVAAMRREFNAHDVVITQMYPANLLPLIPKHKIKSVYVEWGVQATNLFPKPHEKAYIKLIQEAHRYACRKSDIVIAPSLEVFNNIRKYNDNTVNLNLYGIDFERFNFDITDKEIVYKKYPQVRDKKVIIFTGRISPHKNIHLLIDAMSDLLADCPNTLLMIVGRNSFPDYQKQLNAQVKKLGIEKHVIFTGLVDSVVPYLKCADIYCVASAWEGYLNPEPMAMKLPIVCYDAPIHRETVVQGQTGILVNKLTPAAFSGILIGLLHHDFMRLDMGDKAYDTALAKYDYTLIVKKLEKVIGCRM